MEFPLPGYTVTEVLSRGNFLLVRALRHADGLQVILKTLNPELAAAAAARRLKHEFQITRILKSAAIFRATDLKGTATEPILEFIDSGGNALNLILHGGIPVPEFLPIAKKITQALGEVHAQGIIHRDIKPENIILNPSTGELKLADFGIATATPLDLFFGGSRIEGSLPYLSPEQTGRIGRGIDFRSDFYSLGVTFYELLTGNLPFEGKDLPEWIHMHLANRPRPPNALVPAIPETVAQIVLKLMAKMPEDRYQSATGLFADLDRCENALLHHGKIRPFALAQHDHPGRVVFPQKLYGRKRPLRALLTALETVTATGRPAMVLVHGSAGVGKSSLVRELQKSVVLQHGYFASGKFDEQQQNRPYAPILDCFRDLLRIVLTESEERLGEWRQNLQTALGGSAAVATEVLPELEKLLGPQPPAIDLPANESRQRFVLALRQILNVFATREHPLILFVDDLQWGDPATFRFLEEHLPAAKYLLFTGAYRSDEVDSTHPVTVAIELMEKSGLPVVQIPLAPLHPGDVSEFVAAALRMDVPSVRSLASLLWNQTEGNPLFLIRSLSALESEHLLWFDPQQEIWHWNAGEIAAKQIPENLINLLLRQMGKLSSPAIGALKIAAALGSSFRLSRYAAARSLEPAVARQELTESVAQGYLLPEGDTYHFAHDRVQQAAHALMAPVEAREIHLQIGRALLAAVADPDRESLLFLIVDQFYRGGVINPEEKWRLLNLSQRAGRKAKAAGGWRTAAHYFGFAKELLPDNAWEQCYHTCFDVSLEQAECEYLRGNGDVASALFENLLAHCRTRVEKAAVLRFQVRLCVSLGQVPLAIETGYEALRLLGLEVPKNDTELVTAAAEHWNQLRGKLDANGIQRMLALPEMDDAAQRLKADILGALTLPLTATSNLAMCKLLNCVLLETILEHGTSDALLHGCSGIGMVALWETQDYEFAWKMGMLSIELARRSHNPIAKTEVFNTAATMLCYWQSPWETTLTFLSESYLVALEAANYVNAQVAVSMSVLVQLIKGDPVSELDHGFQRLCEVGRKYGPLPWAALEVCLGQFLGGLQETIRPSGQICETVNVQLPHQGVRDIALFLKLTLCCLLREDRTALETYQLFRESGMAERGGLIWVPETRVFGAVLLARQITTASGEPRRALIAEIEEHRAKLRELADLCPPNFSCRFHLIDAVYLQYVANDLLGAQMAYASAVHKAREQGCLLYEGFASELTGDFYQSLGLEFVAHSYLRRAHGCYVRWGGAAKLAQFDAMYPHAAAEHGQTRRLSSSTTVEVERVDLMSVIKAQQLISQEIEWDRFVAQVMNVVLENAGAEKGWLLLKADGALKIEAVAEAGRGLIAPSDESQPLPSGILSYVQRTGESVILDNGPTGNHLFGDDPLLKDRKSVWCMPLLRKGSVQAVLYLENNLMAGAFTPARMEVLRALSGQIAISLENAQHYAYRKKAEAELEQRRQAAEAATRAKDRFLAMLSHELRTPLTPVLAGLEALSDPKDQEQRETLEMMRRNIELEQRLIDDLLDLTRVAQGRFDVRLEPVDAHATIRRVLETCQLQIISKKLRVVTGFEANPPWVQADPGRLQQVIWNIVQNAARFTHQNGRLTIRTLNPSPELCEIRFSDDGIGLEPGDLERIFLPFEQTARTVTRGYGGLGLGLTISKGLLEAQGGTITAESEGLGHGTTFIVRLKVATNFPAVAPEPAMGQANARPAAPARVGNILLVEDHTDTRRLLERMLTRQGYSVTGVPDVRSALDADANDNFDLLVSDIGLPDGTGLELLEKIRERHLLPAIAISGFGMEDDVARSRAAGFREHLVKPIRAAALINTVASVLRT